jgi:hypothetical protein
MGDCKATTQQSTTVKRRRLMAKLCILTLHYPEAKALWKKAVGAPIEDSNPDLREALRKLGQAVTVANPLEKRNGKPEGE